MNTFKAAISTGGQAIQLAVKKRRAPLEKSRLARECLMLSATEDKSVAELGLAADAWEWPEYGSSKQ
ncbi:MAG: CopG family transcriptional regulator [Chthoniobacterales bacterium]